MNKPFQIDLEYAQTKDDIDFLNSFRSRFHFPKHNDQDTIYFCGNSLGLQPRSTSYLFQKELDEWAKWGVEGHFQAEYPWLSYHKQFTESLAKICGAQVNEVVATNTLTVNLHFLMISFYRPNMATGRTKIIMEGGAFPSDQYAVETQVKLHGLNPDTTIIELMPRAGEHTLRPEDILATIKATGDELALVMMGGVNYYTGQLYDMAAITQAAHEVGALAGFDLAHAMGNVPLNLHEWDVDFACWCSYKYLNSGPGGVAGIYVHEKHASNPEVLRLAGWWGNEESTRFKMQKGFIPAPTAESWQMSNAPVFNMIGLKASLDIFDKTTIADLRKKSIELTAYMAFLLEDVKQLDFTVITPKEGDQRGAQLSILFGANGKKVFEILSENGVIADWREPNVIRIAPVPLYNTFEDCYRFYEILKGINL